VSSPARIRPPTLQRLRLAPLTRSRRHTGRLIVLACSESKSSELGRIPAYQRYDGPLWRTLRAADPEGCKATVMFLSARFGLGSACDCNIQHYDARLTVQLADRMIAGGVTATWPGRESRREGMPRGSHAAYEIASLTEYGECPFHDVVLVGGAPYIRVMRAMLAGLSDLGHITKTARIAEINGPIGMMRHALRAWLDGAGECRRGPDDRLQAAEDMFPNDSGPSA